MENEIISSPETIDDNTSMLTNFLNESTMGDGYTADAAENEMISSEGIEEIVNLNDFAVHIPDDDEKTVDLTGKILSDDTEGILYITDGSAEIFEDDEDTVSEKELASETVRISQKSSDIAVEIFEDDEDTIDVSRKKISLQHPDDISESSDTAIEIIEIEYNLSFRKKNSS